MIADPSAIARAAALVEEVIGKPHANGALGPDAYSCWGLTRYAQRTLMGRDLPIVMVDEDSPLAVARAVRDQQIAIGWATATVPMHGDVVTLASPEYPNHVGTYLAIDRGGLLHCVRDGGVRFDRLFQMRSFGWSRIVFHRPVQGADA